MTATSRHASSSASNAPASKRKAYYFYVASVLIALAASAVLVAAMAHAQNAGPAARAQVATAPGVPPSTPVAVATATPRYSAKDIGRAFVFMDANSDGLISRREAASFRNVAKYFDAADTNQDNALSPGEFSSALNRP